MIKSRIEEIKSLLNNEGFFMDMGIDHSNHTFNVSVIDNNNELVDVYSIGLTELYNKIFEDNAEFRWTDDMDN